jgi:hypothetical protein
MRDQLLSSAPRQRGGGGGKNKKIKNKIGY